MVERLGGLQHWSEAGCGSLGLKHLHSLPHVRGIEGVDAVVPLCDVTVGRGRNAVLQLWADVMKLLTGPEFRGRL